MNDMYQLDGLPAIDISPSVNTKIISIWRQMGKPYPKYENGFSFSLIKCNAH